MIRKRYATVTAPVELTHPLVGNIWITPDGVQWSDVEFTGAPNVDQEVFRISLAKEVLLQDSADQLDIAANAINHMYFDLTMAIKAMSATADVKFQWQIRSILDDPDNQGQWIPLHDYITIENVGTEYVERSMSGYLINVNPWDGLGLIPTYPLDLRLVVQSNEDADNGGNAFAKVKNTSVVIVEVS